MRHEKEYKLINVLSWDTKGTTWELKKESLILCITSSSTSVSELSQPPNFSSTFFLLPWNVTVRSNFNRFNLCIVKHNASDFTPHFYRSAQELFQHFRFQKNVHFLINQSCSRKNMHFLFLLAFDHFLYDTLAHCIVVPHCSFALSDVMLAPIHINVLFLRKCCPFKTWV